MGRLLLTMLNITRNSPTSFFLRFVLVSLVCTVASFGAVQTASVASAPNAQSFGQVAVSGSAPATQVLGYVFSGLSVPAVSLAYGTEYTLGAVNCTGSGSMSCSIPVTFHPKLPGLRQDAILIKDSSGNLIGTTLLYGTGLGPQVVLSPGIISTIAGIAGVWGYSGDGGLAKTAALCNPQGIAIDNLGNLYIADSINQVVRQVTAATGQISTVAGMVGAARYTGDGGPAVRATLNNPLAVALDGAGNLYIVDQGNNAIRKVIAATGQITTVAGGAPSASGTDGPGDGGLATNALLSGPNDIAVDGAGNLFIADAFNGLIRRVDASSGVITIVGGAGWRNPTSVAVDPAGNLYLADSGNSMVRRVDPSGSITIVAGTGVFGYSGDPGPATSARLGNNLSVRLDAAGNIYIADGGKSVVRQVNAQSGSITTIAGTGAPGYFGDGGAATSAALKSPAGVAIDAMGNVYTADGNSVIRRISKPTSLAFPSTLIGVASSPQTLGVLNIGNQPLNFTGLAISPNFGQQVAGGTNCSSSTILAPGGSCAVALSFVPSMSGNLSGALTFTNNNLKDASATQSLSLSGTGLVGAVPQLSFSSLGLTFAAQAVGSTSGAQSLILGNTGTAVLNISSIQLGGANASDFALAGGTTCQGTLAPKTTCSISLVFSPTAAGFRTASVILVDNLVNSPQTVTITGTGGAPQIKFSSNTFVFNNQSMGSTSPAQTITISNTGSAPLNIVSLALAGPNAADFGMTSACEASLAAGASCSVSVSFSPFAGGLRTASLTVAANLASSPQSVALTGSGQLATLADGTAAYYYPGADQHVHELYIANGAWHDRDLTAAARGSNISAGASISSLVDTLENLLRINYVGADQHLLHQLYTAGGGNWYDCDLSVTANGPNVNIGVPISSLVDTTQNFVRISYAGADQHVHQLFNFGGAWHDCDLTTAAGGQKIAGNGSISRLVDTTQNLLRINYTAIDQHVHELFVAGGAWHDLDLTAVAGGPNAAAGASIANLIDTISNALRVNYIAVDQHIHEFYIAGGAWHDFDLTAASGGPKVAPNASIENIVDPIANTLRINYAAVDQHTHQFYIYNNAWRDFDLRLALAA